MKFGKFLFCIILTLSLSALDLSLYNSYIEVSASTILDNDLANLESNTNNYINLSDDDYVQVFKENNQMLYLTQSDIYLMSQVVYAESKGEPYEGKVAVASVILNRALNNGFPNTIEGVVYQPRAFSCIVDGQINVEPTQECFDAVYDALSGNDPTGDAVFFYNPDIATCSWMQGVEKHNIISIGQHLFFTL
ncbi:cell wall hydrolase [Clostridium sp. 1001271B_151109_B4]|uniref:cell wall hydrolase n=1 Tax=Clostridium sp. 1001271B_151109_B4 TaxID=2787148 RepID=UPI0018AA059C|nr:cell wall hydrolase [Clostridium sp. 1001271B_151109_B4]